MRKKHAKHNEEVCDHLLTTKKFNDWVITTAFYSSLHYIQHEIFPLKENGIVYRDLNFYFAKVGVRGLPKTNKHKVTIHLVVKYIPKASKYYRWLYDACMNARYRNYHVSFEKAQTAYRYLNLLKGELKK